MSKACKHILIVDDAATVRMYHRSILEEACYAVTEAVNGLEALEKAASAPGYRPFDLYLVDVNMPQMDGYGFLRALRAGEVPQAARARFFEKYAPSDKIGGNGLGTYSIRLMAEVHGGSVSMDTGHGRTRLTITLPCP